MAQTWHDLLFAHWPIPSATMRPLVPNQLELDGFDGSCWVGVVPFWMSGIHARALPALPGLSRFPELNVRTYVRLGDRPGVYFFSLDAANLSAVWAARTFYHLPYFHAAMAVHTDGDAVTYRSRRYRDKAEFRGSYRALDEAQLCEKGTLAHWLTERYCLYTLSREKLYRAEIHHPPWPLQDAQAEIEVNTMATAAGITLPDTAPILHFARRLEVLIWSLRPVT